MASSVISRPFVIGATTLAVASGALGYTWRHEHRAAHLEVYVFNLKNGNSIFIRTPHDRRILVDGGGNAEVVRHISRIIPFYSRRIDTVIVTRPDPKNISGLIDVVSRYEVGKVVVSRITLDTIGIVDVPDRTYSVFVEMLRQRSIPIEKVVAGEHIALDVENVHTREPVVADILFPASPQIFSYSKTSPPDILFKITYGSTSILYVGGATPKMHKHISKHGEGGIRGNPIGVDVLVVSHSALPQSLDFEFVRGAHPDFLVYSRSLTYRDTRSSQPEKTDPLFFLLDDRRFNVKNGRVKITSDGTGVEVKNAP